MSGIVGIYKIKMKNLPAKLKVKSDQHINFPQISHSKSVPVVHHVKRQNFSLRFVNDHMPHYDPSKDRFLSHYFEQKSKQRVMSQPSKQIIKERKSAKTLPSEQKEVRVLNRRQKLMTLQCQKPYREQGIKEISKQQFGNFLQMMREKLDFK